MKFIYYTIFIGSLFSLNNFAMEKEPISTLPFEMKMEIIKQIINNSQTRSKAIETLKNYALANKLNQNYIQKNIKLINNLLDKRFNLTLKEFESGNWDDQHIQEEKLRILKKIQPTTDQLSQNSITNLINAITTQTFTNDIYNALEWAIEKKNYQLIAIIIGAYNKFGQTAVNDYFDVAIYVDTVNKFVALFSKNQSLNTDDYYILDLLTTLGKKLFGQNFVTAIGQNTDLTVINYAQDIGNKEIIQFLESKLSQ